jgi:hypothetical protein
VPGGSRSNRVVGLGARPFLTRVVLSSVIFFFYMLFRRA